MEQIQQLRQLGESLGYEGNELRAFVKDQQDRLRDERAALRQEQKNELECKALIEKANIEKSRTGARTRTAATRPIRLRVITNISRLRFLT